MSLPYILGILLLLWAGYDLIHGRVWLHREFQRSNEPWAYWSTLSLWLLVALSCFVWEI